MKHFKLIKGYPESPKIGTFVKQDNLGQYVSEDPLRIYEKSHVENYPEYWQEMTVSGEIKLTATLKEFKKLIEEAMQQYGEEQKMELLGDLNASMWTFKKLNKNDRAKIKS